MKKKLSKIFGISLAIVLLASLTLVAVPVGATVSSPTVSQTEDDISQPSTYTLIFSITKALNAATPDTIDVEFPAGFDVSGATAQLAATSGIGTTAFPLAAANVTVDGVNAQLLHIDVNNESGDGGDDIGVGATVQLVIGTDAATDVTNGPSLGDDYVLKVNTSVTGETIQVDSDTFSLVAPTISAVPGIVRGYNASDVLLFEDTGDTAITDAIATSGVVTIEIGPGTYDEDVVANVAGQTIISTDGSVVTIIEDADADTNGGTLTASAAVTIDGLTVNGRTFGVQATVVDVTVQNCVLSGTTIALDINAGTTADPAVSMNNSITVATGDIGIDVANGIVVTSSGDTITATGTGEGIVNDGVLTLTGATINGASGVGIRNTANGDAAISGCTFSGLDTAIDVDAGTVDVSTSTITGCGSATTGALKPAINVDAATMVTIGNSTIADCVDEILNVEANSDLVFMNFNAITNPAKGIDNNEAAANTLDATNNLWDGGVAPPVTMSPLSATQGMIDTTPYLVAATDPTAQLVVGAATMTTQTTLGVNIVSDATGGNEPASMAAATYASNPGTAAVPGVASAYFDVYVNDTGSDATTYTISLFGAVDANTIAYVWGAGLGEWVECSNQAVNVFAGSVSITVTAITTPTIADLVGLPLAIAQPAAAAPTVALTSLVPDMGADEVSVDPTFAWGAVAGATYEFALAEDLALADAFSVIDYSATADVNAHPCRQTLKYSTTYYWRVRAIVGSETGPWTTGLFTTEAEPAVEEDGDIVVEQPDITVESPDVTVQPADVDITVQPAEQVIPDYLLWVIIAVGAVLVIALIVLIVRTRRTA